MNISGYGFKLRLIADKTYPIGFDITEFSDDQDAMDIPELNIAETAMGLNGDLIKWSKASPIIAHINVIPTSESDIALSILLEANRVGFGKVGARDDIILTGIFEDGRFFTLTNGIITDGNILNSVSNDGRIKTKTYSFAFENKAGVV